MDNPRAGGGIANFNEHDVRSQLAGCYRDGKHSFSKHTPLRFSPAASHVMNFRPADKIFQESHNHGVRRSCDTVYQGRSETFTLGGFVHPQFWKDVQLSRTSPHFN